MTNYLAKKAMLTTLTISQWGARRLDKRITDEVNASHGAVADAGRYNKLIIAKDAIAPIQKIVSEARTLHINMTLPWVDGGARILPSSAYLDYTKRMSAMRDDFERAVEKFCDEYRVHVEKRRVELNGLFRERDYPSPRDIHRKFAFDVILLPCPDAGDFRVDLAKEHAEDIKAGIEARMQNALKEAMADPVHRVIEVVGHMAEKLRAYKPGESDGARTSYFKDTLVSNVRELVTLLPSFNLTDDPAMAKLTRAMETELCVEDAPTLRANQDVRDAVADSAEAILAQARAMMA